jgi:hypothetical protein
MTPDQLALALITALAVKWFAVALYKNKSHHVIKHGFANLKMVLIELF